MKKRFSNNKGFSLVELIIVVAIMAVLIGILAPQYLKYVEKSKLSADNDYIDSVRKACETAISDPNSTITDGFTISFSKSKGPTISDSNADTEINKIVTADENLTEGALTSKTYSTASDLPLITVTMDDEDNDGIVDPQVTITHQIN